jgi:hypothetical protein
MMQDDERLIASSGTLHENSRSEAQELGKGAIDSADVRFTKQHNTAIDTKVWEELEKSELSGDQQPAQDKQPVAGKQRLTTRSQAMNAAIEAFAESKCLSIDGSRSQSDPRERCHTFRYLDASTTWRWPRGRLEVFA